MKIALISMKEDNYWQSCRSITSGLREAYLTLGKPFSVLEWKLSSFLSDEAVMKIAREILSKSPEIIVLLDTGTVYGRLLFALSKLKKENSSHDFLVRFHVYGDFTLRAYQWLDWTQHLRGLRVEWACASLQQKKLLETTFQGDEKLVWVCPFPVSERDFKFDSKLRKTARKKLGIKTDEFAILYTGRMTLQKNVIASLRAFALLNPTLLKRTKFIFAGEFDDLGSPFDPAAIPRGGFFAHWQDEIKKLSPDLSARVTVLRGLGRESLRGLYSAADVFLSLSLQHDEDFGMAPAEASISGLPLVLTQWGGYAGLYNLNIPINGVPVVLTDSGPTFDLSTVADELTKVSEKTLSDHERHLRGRKCSQVFSLRATHDRLRSRMKDSMSVTEEFSKFHPLVETLSLLYNPITGTLSFSSRGKGSAYEQIYKNYVGLQDV